MLMGVSKHTKPRREKRALCIYPSSPQAEEGIVVSLGERQIHVRKSELNSSNMSIDKKGVEIGSVGGE